VSDVFHGKDRTLAGDTAVSAGLYLVGVKYPKEFNIPFVADAPAFMALSI
jgi:tRNA pseudouridine38-40 synthase